ncbi:four-carbon acid sugar kinase family protein [Salipaludibacillus sp. CF4.18]|uniref:four-carbon acid sugar kinase family protein n=1 Tax=Salipaludibacillus sp. CF4.18 TaxID=3373081 RepID=UPI003EE51D75
MRIGIIADDLTGANDSGVQLSRYGLQTSVRFNLSNTDTRTDDAIVIDTDSRSIDQNKAYDRVRKAAGFLKENKFDVIYKKIDSTLRGNLGIEVDAVYDEFQPDFVIIAPAYPKNGRKIKSGHLYLHDVPVNESEIANDPKCPVEDSHIGHVFQKQTNRPFGYIRNEEIRNGFSSVKAKMDEYAKKNIPYLVFDSETEEDLEKVARFVHDCEYNVIWLGSAGLANYLPEIYNIEEKVVNHTIEKNNHPVLLVVGSVSSITRKQLEVFLGHELVEGVELTAPLLISEQSWEKEIEIAYQKAKTIFRKGKHVALFSTGDSEAIKEAQLIGENAGLTNTEVSNLIVKRLGYLTDKLIQDTSIKGIILTGGDTAKQVCQSIEVNGIQLIDEIETGVPIGKLIGRNNIYAVTKAGAFGTEDTFMKSTKILQGVESE